VTVLLVGGIAAGVALRVWVLASPLGGFDADEAVWGLMARHLLDGELPTFFWGQAYGGTLETFLTAPVFALFGSSILALRVVPIVLFAVAAVLVWRVGRYTVGEPAARIAAVAFWLWPSYLVWKSTRAHGFYGAVIVLALVIVLLALRLRERDSPFDFAALGLVLGLGWWTTPQIAFVALPALAWLVWRRPAVARGAWLVIPAAIMGAAPWLIWNVGHGWESLDVPFEPGNDTYVDHLRTFVYATLPSALGLRVPFSLDWLLGEVVSRILEALALAAVGWLLIRRRGRREPLLVVVALYPFLQSLSPFSSLNFEPRYLVLLMPFCALLVAELVSRRTALAAATLAALAALSVAGLARMESAYYRVPTGALVRVSPDIGPLLTTLRAADVTRVFAQYSVAYRLTFESDEAIIATPGGVVSRYPPHERAVLASRSPAYVFVAGSEDERAAAGRLEGRGYRLVDLGDWSVYLPPRR
jgi:4-amino-4-deoxy-L-arabinose transferase-like glycosyltransferase